MRRRWWFITTFVLFILAGVIAALAVPTQYSYTTTLNVGKHTAAQSVLSKNALALFAWYILPKLANSYATKHAPQTHFRHVGISLPENGNTVIMDVTGTAESYRAALNHPANSKLLVISMIGPKGKRTEYAKVQKNIVEKVSTLLGRLDKNGDQTGTNANTGNPDHATTPPLAVRSQKPVSTNKLFIVLASAVIGLFCAFLLTLLVDFLESFPGRPAGIVEHH